MRLSKEMLRELALFIRVGVPVRLGYNKGTPENEVISHRSGTLENVGDGPNGPNITLKNGDNFRCYSMSKVEYVDLG